MRAFYILIQFIYIPLYSHTLYAEDNIIEILNNDIPFRKNGKIMTGKRFKLNGKTFDCPHEEGEAKESNAIAIDNQLNNSGKIGFNVYGQFYYPDKDTQERFIDILKKDGLLKAMAKEEQRGLPKRKYTECGIVTNYISNQYDYSSGKIKGRYKKIECTEEPDNFKHCHLGYMENGTLHKVHDTLYIAKLIFFSKLGNSISLFHEMNEIIKLYDIKDKKLSIYYQE